MRMNAEIYLGGTVEIEEVASLIPLAKRGAIEERIYLTSGEFAQELGTSQQTANRRLQMLEERGFIERTGSPRRQQVILTEKGAAKMKDLFFTLYNIFSKSENEITIRGRLITGMGEGKYYISQQGYRNQFIQKLGFSLYPGTFNLKLDDNNLARFNAAIEKLTFIPIEGFKTEDRSFGAVKAYKAKVGNKIDGAIIIPYRTHHDENIVEIVAPTYLRKALAVNEGDAIDVTIYG